MSAWIAFAIAIIMIVVGLRLVTYLPKREGACPKKNCMKSVYGPSYWHLTGYPDAQYLNSGAYHAQTRLIKKTNIAMLLSLVLFNSCLSSM
jgi:hypothetical protein